MNTIPMEGEKAVQLVSPTDAVLTVGWLWEHDLVSNRMVKLKDPTPEKTAAIIGRPNIYTKVGFFVGKDEFKYAFVSTNSVMIEEEPKIAQKIRHITSPEMQPGGEIVIANIVARDKWTINTIGIGGYEHLTFSMPVHAQVHRRYNLGAFAGAGWAPSDRSAHRPDRRESGFVSRYTSFLL